MSKTKKQAPNGWERVTSSLIESFNAATETGVSTAHTAISLIDKKLFNGRFHNRIPDRETMRPYCLALTFTAAASMAVVIPTQAFGLMGFGAAWLIQKMPKNTQMRAMITTVSALHATQYAINDNMSGLAMSSVNAVRSSALTGIPEEQKRSRNMTAGTCAAIGLGLVFAGAADNPSQFYLSLLPAVSVSVGAFSDVLPDKRSHLARACRLFIHSCNTTYDVVVSGNIGGIATNLMILHNIRRNAIEQGDFSTPANNNENSSGYLKSLTQEKPILLKTEM